MQPDLWGKISERAVHLCCGGNVIPAGEVGVDIRPQPQRSKGRYYQMDALDFLILKCADSSLAVVTLIHGPEHLVHARFCALALTVERKLRPGGRFIVEFPDIGKNLRVEETFGVESWTVAEHLSGWTEEMMREVLAQAGFAEVTSRLRRYSRLTAVKGRGSGQDAQEGVKTPPSRPSEG